MILNSSGKSILQNILAFLARATIRKYQPVVIGITGSVGKTSARQAIFAVLKKRYRVRTAEKNYNNEIGLPLTILGIQHRGRNIFRWFSALFRAALSVALRQRQYPEILVLEYGVDHPGDMAYLLSISRPHIAVVTAIGDIPAHVEFFKSPEELIAEKGKLVAALPPDGYAILNHDDPAVYDMKLKTKARVVTYGFEEHADFKITNYKLQITKDEKLGAIPDGLAFKIEYKRTLISEFAPPLNLVGGVVGGHSLSIPSTSSGSKSVVPFRIHNAFGLPHVYSAAAASAVGLIMDLNLVEISEALRDYTPPPGRLRLLRGIKNSFILDDTYNAAPEAMRAALDTLKVLPGQRKIAVLGDMLEIGKYSEQAHRAIGDQAAGFVDLLLCVGSRAKFIAEEYTIAGARGASGIPSAKNSLRGAQTFDDPVSAGKALQSLIQPGDLILVKGSQAMRMEKAIYEIMAEPQRAAELLVRQDEYWLKK